MTQIVVPALGESVTEATVAQWLKKEGDAVKADEPIVALETDKVTLEVNAPEDGVISSIVAAEGAEVEVGAILGEIGAGSAANDTPEKSKETKKETKEVKEEKPKETKKEDSSQDSDVALSPAVRKMVEDHNLDPAKIKGTGKDGRLLKEDVQAFLDGGGKAAEAAPTEAVSTHPVTTKESAAPREAGEREERVKMTRLRQRIAERLKHAQNTAAMLTSFNEVDMSAVMDLRSRYKENFEKKHGVKLGFMSFFAKACVSALKEIPAVNAEIDGNEIIYKNYYDISIAVSTPQGLIVPVVRDCDNKSMADIERDILDLGTRAREGKITMEELQGGTFTITNGGVFGSLLSTPIINPPQSGILGMHKIEKRAVVQEDGSIVAKPMMYLALSYDHRIIDGREAVTFLVHVKEALENPQRMLLNI